MADLHTSAGNGGKMKKYLITLLLFAAVISLIICGSAVSALPTYADYTGGDLIGARIAGRGDIVYDAIDISMDGFSYEGEVFVIENTAYVSLREFACAADNSVVSWDSTTSTAYVKTDSLTMSAQNNSYYITANGRIIWCDYGVFIMNGTMYTPLIPTAQAFGFGYDYSAEDRTNYLTRYTSSIKSADEYYNKDDLYWLAQIINAESGGEPFFGKLAVGNVVMNRVESNSFPETVYGVVFDSNGGVQFTPTVDGAINKPASEESVLAAKICLENIQLSDDILFFLNEQTATSFWIVENCDFVVSIGNHNFYAP